MLTRLATSIWLFLIINAGIQALPIFGRDSSPSTLSAYTSTRSVFDIVWSCIVTTFLCTWVSIHPNTLPKQAKSLEKLLLRIFSLLLTLFAPEIVVGWASKELVEAKRVVSKFQKKGFKISMIHAYLINMGSFALCYPEAKVREISTREDLGLSSSKTVRRTYRAAGKERVEEDNNAKEKSGNNVQEGKSNDQQIQEGSRKSPTVAEETSNTFNGPPIINDDLLLNLRYIETLSAKRFLELLSQPKPAIRFPLAALDELKDRSKTDGLSSFITALQVLWFVVQCIVRRVEGLAMTQLELSTVALASLNAYMLWMWWGKPQGVAAQIPVYLLEDSVEWENRKSEWEARINDIASGKKEEKESTLKRVGDVIVGRSNSEERTNDISNNIFVKIFNKIPFVVAGAIAIVLFIPSLTIFGVSFAVLYPLIYLLRKSARISKLLEKAQNSNIFEDETAVFLGNAVYLGIVFGGLHCAGWNFSFPTTVEQTLWRVMSLVLTVTPSTTFFFYSLANILTMKKIPTPTIKTYFLILSAITLVAYTIARLSLFVLMLISLRSLPDTAYLAVSWTKLFPHPSQ